MHIKIITFHYTTNYGATLQAYALSHYLQMQGHSVQIVDYRPEAIKKNQYLWRRFLSDFSAKAVILQPIQLMRSFRFRRFSHKYFDLTKVIDSADEISKLRSTDLFITGSDQVWNPIITGGFDNGFLLQFETTAKRISFAASVAIDNVAEDVIETIAKKIATYDGISVRETDLCEKLRNHGLSNAISVLDPVFLLNNQEYSKLAAPQKYKNYVLVYEMSFNPETRILAHKIAQEQHLEVVDLSSFLKKTFVNHVVRIGGPEQFLSLMMHAEYVITNSFHGTAFSIVLRKQFYAFPAGQRTSRLKSLLERVELDDRLLEVAQDVTQLKEIDYSKKESIIQQQIEKGKVFLTECCMESMP